MSLSSSAQTCRACAADLRKKRSYKSAGGEQLCVRCYGNAPLTDGTAAWQTLEPCIFCGSKAPRLECHRNRYGEFICRRCSAEGKRWSRRRVVQRALIRCLLYLGGIALLFVILWKVFAMLGR